MLKLNESITCDITTSTASTTLPVTIAIIHERSMEKLLITYTRTIVAANTMPITSISLFKIVLSIINVSLVTNSPSPNDDTDAMNSEQNANVKYRYVPKNAGTIPTAPAVSPTITGAAYGICSINITGTSKSTYPVFGENT